MTREPAIRYARWAPVTAGEYDHATGEIVVNLTVVDAVARTTAHPAALVESAIVAHERAHAAAPATWTRAREEAASRAAAVATAGLDVVLAIEDVLRRAVRPSLLLADSEFRGEVTRRPRTGDPGLVASGCWLGATGLPRARET